MPPPPPLPPAIRTTITVVLGLIALSSIGATFFRLPPGPWVESILHEWGINSMRMVFAGTFFVEGLAVLAILLPSAVIVNVLRAWRDRNDLH